MSRRAWSLLGGLGLALGAAQADDAPPPADAAVLGDRVLNLAAPRDGWSVQASATAGQALTWPMFIREVLASNLDFAAQRYNVDMAQADAEAARLLPNPSLSLSGDRDLTFHDRYATGTDGQPALLRQPENRSIGLDQTLEWPGKRHWRIKMADQTLRAAAATLQDFLRNLKLDAASAFADALLAQRTVEQLRAAAGFLAELDQAQQARFKAGDIGQPDLAQSQVEEQQFLNQLSKAEDDAEATRYALSTFLGRDRGRTDFVVSGELAQAPRDLDLAATLAEALKNRADLVALRHARDAAQSGVSLAKASIVPDVDVGLSYGYNSSVAPNHPVDPTPGFHQLTLNLGIPLPLFDHGQYGVAKARAAAEQAQVQLAAAELHAEVDIRTAYAACQSARKRVASFQNGILDKADQVLEARRYGYQRGANSLLDLIDAQRADNQIRQDYDQALADQAKAAIQLERVTAVEQGIRF
ncbi:MAG TPA: TolC family protein [Nevskia sp.]|nr:TolC family protein [Nevskia sp.]